jgi:hypothetical protein
MTFSSEAEDFPSREGRTSLRVRHAVASPAEEHP